MYNKYLILFPDVVENKEVVVKTVDFEGNLKYL